MSDDLFDDPGLFAPTPRPTVFERLAEAGKTASSGNLETTQIVQESPALPPRRSRPIRQPEPAKRKPPEPVSTPYVPKVSTDDGPVASFACFCGFRDEVKKPAPDRLFCPECKTENGLVRYVPRYAPPPHSARELTDKEVARLT